MSTDNPQNKDLITDEPGSHPVGTGVGTLGGALAGAAAGAVAGPAGIIIGAVAGGVAGGLAGHHVGEGVNPSVGVVSDDENAVGTGVGSTAGAYAGNEAEEAIDNRHVDTHEYKNQAFADRINQKRPLTPVEPDTVVITDTTYVDRPFVPDTLNDRPLDERDYKKTDI